MSRSLSAQNTHTTPPSLGRSSEKLDSNLLVPPYCCCCCCSSYTPTIDCCFPKLLLSIWIKAPTKLPEPKTTENISSWPDPTGEVTALGPLTSRETPHRLWEEEEGKKNPEVPKQQRPDKGLFFVLSQSLAETVQDQMKEVKKIRQHVQSDWIQRWEMTEVQHSSFKDGAGFLLGVNFLFLFFFFTLCL